jgi:hypothetical protein
LEGNRTLGRFASQREGSFGFSFVSALSSYACAVSSG